jgi:uncharacterized SAM-binding protein YcdF (DUF218 family)
MDSVTVAMSFGNRGAKRPPSAFARETALTLVLAAAFGWWVGLFLFIAAIPEAVADPESETDVIVVLTGGAERLATGLKLLENNKAPTVFVSGVNPQVGSEQMLRAAAGSSHRTTRLAPRVVAGYGARDTPGNAAETAAWIRRHGYRSLRLVTSNYHMPRSLLEFAHALPEVRIIPHPVISMPSPNRTWWRRPNDLGMVVQEYNKFVLTALKNLFSSLLSFRPATGEAA